MNSTPSLPVTELVGAAIQAPSSHNTQPWYFHETATGIAVFADRTRALPVNDPYDRELTISCGAALFNLRVAAGRCGLDADVSLLPRVNDPDLLANVTLSPGEPQQWLFEAIANRHTTRDQFADTTVDEDTTAKLVEVAAQHGAWLEMVEGNLRSQVAELVAEGDRMQFSDSRWRRELASWMHPRRRGDGLVVPEVFGIFTKAVVSAIDLGKSVASKDDELIADAPVVAVLGTDGDTVTDWLNAGQALEAVLLTAAQNSLQAGYLNQPCQIFELRPRLQQALGTSGHPQIVFRLGHPVSQLTTSPRRPVSEVLEQGE